MIPAKYFPEEELISEVIRILTEKFGSLETFRFLSIAKQKRMIIRLPSEWSQQHSCFDKSKPPQHSTAEVS